MILSVTYYNDTIIYQMILSQQIENVFWLGGLNVALYILNNHVLDLYFIALVYFSNGQFVWPCRRVKFPLPNYQSYHLEIHQDCITSIWVMWTGCACIGTKVRVLLLLMIKLTRSFFLHTLMSSSYIINLLSFSCLFSTLIFVSLETL